MFCFPHPRDQDLAAMLLDMPDPPTSPLYELEIHANIKELLVEDIPPVTLIPQVVPQVVRPVAMFNHGMDIRERPDRKPSMEDYK